MTENQVAKDESTGNREGLKIWGLVILATLLGLIVAFQFVQPAPPDSIVLATGTEDGAYHGYGLEYITELESYGIEVELLPSAGSVENLSLLQSGAADAAFLQGGVTSMEFDEELVGVASLYYEPLWIFHRIDLSVSRLTDLTGKRVQVGAEGSGTRAVTMDLLGANGIDASNTTLLGLSSIETVKRLLAAEIDAAFLVISAEGEAISKLMRAEGKTVQLLDVNRHLGYERRFPYLDHAILAEGVLDFERNIPDRQIDMLAPMATLVAREELHPALIPLFIQAAERIHGGGDIFAAPGVFPSPDHLDFPLAESARWYFETGPSFLYRVFPFQLAAAIDRLKIMLLPLLTLLVPLFKVAPPLYRWSIRSKIYRWYKKLDHVERLLPGAKTHADGRRCVEALEKIQREVRETVNVPASYMEELYNLRMHLDRLHEEVARSFDANA